MPFATGQFWRSYWIALQRSKKDTRARGLAFRIMFWLAHLLASVAFLYFLGTVILSAEGGVETIVFYGVFWGLAVTGLILLRRAHKRQDDALKFSLTGAKYAREKADEVSEAVRYYLAERTAIIGLLFARAGSEIHLQFNELPPGMRVVTTQMQNTLLRERGFWDRLEPPESD